VENGRKRQPSRYISVRGRTNRAVAGYVDLLEAAEQLKERMTRQLGSYYLTMLEFRLLASILHDGPQYQIAISHRFRCSKQNIGRAVESLRERGYLRRKMSALPTTPSDGWANPERAASMQRPVRGRRIAIVRLTPQGREFIKYVYPKHAKVVKSVMRVLDGREQLTLSRLCLKLKEGDAVKMLKELLVRRGRDRQD
jgi:DNA-binding MarR family transcriptional regulator